MSFLGLTGKTYLVLGVANKKSVAWHVAKTLESEGAKVVYSVRSQARLDSLKGLLDGKPVYLCDLEHEAQTQQLAAAVGREHGPLDGVLHSVAFANFSKGMQPFHETVRADFLQATAISAFSLVEVARTRDPGDVPPVDGLAGINPQVKIHQRIEAQRQIDGLCPDVSHCLRDACPPLPLDVVAHFFPSALAVSKISRNTIRSGEPSPFPDAITSLCEKYRTFSPPVIVTGSW